MGVAVIFDAEVFVEYGQLNLIAIGYADFDPDDLPDRRSSFRGQKNGLCGAAVESFLYLRTGIDYGPTMVRVELHHNAPKTSDYWDDVVEVSLLVRPGESVLRNLRDDHVILGIPGGRYRVRYGIHDMDRGKDVGTTSEPVDAHVLQLWMSELRDDSIVRTGSRNARLVNESLKQ